MTLAADIAVGTTPDPVVELLRRRAENAADFLTHRAAVTAGGRYASGLLWGSLRAWRSWPWSG